jgi:hypothetical protein
MSARISREPYCGFELETGAIQIGWSGGRDMFA